MLQKKNALLRFVGVAGLFSWFAILIYNFTQDSFAIPNIWINFGVLVGMADLDMVKRGLDQLVRKETDAVTGKVSPKGMAYQSLLVDLRNKLDDMTIDPQTGQSVYKAARSNNPEHSPNCRGAISPASSPAGNGKVCFWIAVQEFSMGCHDCSPANNGSWIGSEMEKATFNNGSCIRLSTTSLGIDLQASQSRMPKAEATQIVMPAITNMETPKGLNQPANKIPPLIPAMIIPKKSPARRKSNCKPQEFVLNL